MRKRISSWQTAAAALAMGLSVAPAPAAAPAPRRPNVLFILADDLGYGDVGVFFQDARHAANDRSQPSHLTPHLDELAASGIQLRGHYCPAPVCAPSRASLLQGVTQGHANVRNNQFDKALGNNHTLATVLGQAGYATICIGKWGLQGKPSPTAPHGWPAHPMNRGFDEFFGYISHRAGHWHYPKEDKQKLYDGDTDVAAQYDRCYTTDLFTGRAKHWITAHEKAHPTQPFFMYLAYDTPHAKLEYPPAPYPAGGGLTGGMQWPGTPGRMITTASGTPDSYCYPEYARATWDDDHNPATPEKPWPDVYKRYASDVRRVDDGVGDVMQLLRDLHIDRDTLVVFTSDNGPSRESYLPENYEPTFFGSYGPFDGIKRDCWEGGIRVGAIASWPGRIPPGRVSQEPSGFWDWMPTFASLAGVPAPARTDGVSLLPTLTGVGRQKPSDLYIEYFEANKTPNYPQFAPAHRGRVRRQMQAIRVGDFVGVRYNIASQADPFEIYNILTDPQETKNLASEAAYASLQQQMKDAVLQDRRPNNSARRPYDDELVPPSPPAGRQAPGVQWSVYPGTFPWVPKLDDMTPSGRGTSTRFVLPARALKKDGAVLFTGSIQAPADGVYTFTLSADTGALLRIHNAVVIDADWGYRSGAVRQGIIRLKAGPHPFRLYYLHRGAAASRLQLQWSSPTIPAQEIPAAALSHAIPPSGSVGK